MTSPMSAKQRQATKTVALQILYHAHVPYLGSMTPCALRRLIYLAGFTSLQSVLGDVPFTLGKDIHGDSDIVSPGVDDVIEELTLSGLAHVHDMAGFEITPLGKDLHNNTAEAKPFNEVADRLIIDNEGFFGPYGSRLLALGRHCHEAHPDKADDAMSLLRNLIPDVSQQQLDVIMERVYDVERLKKIAA